MHPLPEARLRIIRGKTTAAIPGACLIAVSLIWLTATNHLLAQVPDNLVVEGIPTFSEALKREASRYLEFRTAAFQDWHPSRREMLITTRFAETPQLHLVAKPGGARRQLTFFGDRVAGGSFQPRLGEYLVYSQDQGGAEFYQLYRYGLSDGAVQLLTDGRSRNMGGVWSRDGQWVAYTSTRRNGKDTDVYAINPGQPSTDRLVWSVSGGGWQPLDWSPDNSRLLILEYRSINESYLHVLDVNRGTSELLTPKGSEPVSFAGGRFTRDGESVLTTSDRGSDFRRLVRLTLASKETHAVTENIPWDVEDFDLSPDGRRLAFTVNEAGGSSLRLLDARRRGSGRTVKIPTGVITGVRFHENSRDLGFTLSSAQSPSDAFSVDTRSGRLERWTESEVGGLNPSAFVEPVLVKTRSFDGLEVSGFLYAPDPKRFPGKRPLLVIIHGGPESQSRPGFLGRNNYLLNELGIALLYPNVRGSSGYGKRFLTLDNGMKREDSVKDIGAFLDWAETQPGLDAQRMAVMGGSYGGYMTLASLVDFGNRLRCGVDVVGISHFVTFLKNTEGYRRDLRRAEYGDEQDAAMAAHLDRISPLTNAKRITQPLLVVQGKNDPRVPVTEAEQMIRAIRENGGNVWYLMAKDEGHGFAKKRNADYQFLATIEFLKRHLLPVSAIRQ